MQKGWLAELRRELKQSVLTPWIALFLVLSVAVTQYGGTNALARMAGLRAITENGTLHIDRYVSWTHDWSLSPNGHYYPNKAPGGVLLGLPVFALLDAPTRWLQYGKRDALGRVPQPPYAEHLLFNLLTQMLPFALLVLWIGRALRERGVHRHGILYFGLAALFGNTAAIYLNCYFGHGLAALLFLAGFFCWLERRYAPAGLFVAATTLTDYGGACVVPFFLLATLWRERAWRPLFAVAMGAAPMGAVWAWYHTAAFGSPLAVASAFINPAQVEELDDRASFFGTLALLPSPSIVLQLLFGPERGILFTQPWVFVAGIFALRSRAERLPRGTFLFLMGGLAALLWMNGSVGGWHGGWTIGPRYLSLLFPAMALSLAWGWDEAAPWMRSLAWAALGVALAFRLLVYPFSNLAPLENLWAYHAQQLWRAKSGTPYLRLAIALVLSGLAAHWWWRREERHAD